MRRALIIVIAALIVAGLTATAAVIAFRGSDNEASEEPIRVTPDGSSSIGIVSTGVSTAEPLARLPGITVVGVGEVEVKPDVAVVRLTVGSGSSFSGSDETIELIDEEELEPVVKALVAAGAPEDDIYVNTFSSPYGSENAALITFRWPKPQDVEEILRTAQDTIRKQTKYNLQGVAVSFGRDKCEGPEETAMNAALADARARAEQLAALSGATLGNLIAVSEAASGGYLAALTPQRCGVDEQLAPGLFEYQAANGTTDEVTVMTMLEVTFALER